MIRTSSGGDPRRVLAWASLALAAACAPAPRDTSAAGVTARFESRTVRVGGHPVYAVVSGRGPAVVLIHGAGGSSRDFTFDLVGRLDDRYRVIAVDRPGHGRTPALGRGRESPAQQAALLDAAVGELGVERAVIAGQSYGGAVALAWALDQPERAAAAVTISGAVMPWKGELGAIYPVLASRLGGAVLAPLVASFVPRRVVDDMLHEVFAPQEVPEGYLAHLGTEATLNAATIRADARQLNALKAELGAIAPRYPTLDLPVEVLHGASDRLLEADEQARALAERVPGATLTILDGVGHMPHHARPEAVVAAIDRAAVRAGLR